MRKILVGMLAAASVLGVFAAPAAADNGAQTTTLLTSSGSPRGGQWQSWMNDSYAPTYPGSTVLAFAPSARACGGAGLSETAACTAGGAFTPVASSLTLDPETLINTFQTFGAYLAWQRWVLMYEQGHVLDFELLSDTMRSELLALWGQPPLPPGEQMSAYWWDGESGDSKAYGEWFSEGYALCALYRRWGHAAFVNSRDWNRTNGYDFTYPGWGASRQALEIQRQTCSFIRHYL